MTIPSRRRRTGPDRLLPRRLAAAGAGLLLVAVPASAGWARWTAAGSGQGSATTATLAAPTNLTVTKPPAAGTVRVAWNAPAAPGGGTVSGYYVTRRAGSTPSPACGTSPTALLPATTCDDTGLASGTYTYTVTAVFRTWTATSAVSAAVSVVASAAPVAVSIVRAGGAPQATSSNESLQWTVTFSKPVTGVDAADFVTAPGNGLGGTPAVTGVTGSGAVYTVTASTGSGSGTLGLKLVDDDSITDSAGNRLGGTGTGNGNVTGATYTLDRIIASVALVNGSGTAGQIDTGDRIVIRFSRAMDFTTFCGAWLDVGGGLVDLNLLGGTKVTVRVAGNGFGRGNDTLTVPAGNCGLGTGAPRFGSIDLASPEFVNGTRDFTDSPMRYDTAARTLTITLGPGSGNARPAPSTLRRRRTSPIPASRTATAWPSTTPRSGSAPGSGSDLPLLGEHHLGHLARPGGQVDDRRRFRGQLPLHEELLGILRERGSRHTPFIPRRGPGDEPLFSLCDD